MAAMMATGDDIAIATRSTPGQQRHGRYLKKEEGGCGALSATIAWGKHQLTNDSVLDTASWFAAGMLNTTSTYSTLFTGHESMRHWTKLDAARN